MSEPKISIIIPVYNVEKYLAECLDSCINQTLKDIEIICVDDASPDNSIKILEEYQQKDSRIKILRHETNKNLGAARNTGLANATGEYVWFVDSDDYIDTKACQILYDAIKEFDVDMLCFSALSFLNINEKRKYFRPDSFQGVQINKVYHPKTNWKEIKFYNLNVSACMYLTKRNVIQKFRFREDVWHEDTDFTPILFSSVDSFCYIPYTAYFRRINPESITQKAISQKRLEDLIDMLGALDKFVTEYKINRKHFLYEFLVSQIDYIFELCQSTKNTKPNNLSILSDLKTKYRRPKYSAKRFIEKIVKKLLGDF
ncbi:glycosyltransferase family 2 protein [bacterium]|nr:glycosyltransferase family 2 protein [bacterium]